MAEFTEINDEGPGLCRTHQWQVLAIARSGRRKIAITSWRACVGRVFLKGHEHSMIVPGTQRSRNFSSDMRRESWAPQLMAPLFGDLGLERAAAAVFGDSLLIPSSVLD